MEQGPGFMDELKRSGPKFSDFISTLMAKTQEAGALGPKTETLITPALDAASSHPEGVSPGC